MFRKGLYILLLISFLPKLSSAQVVFRSVEDLWKYADDHNVTIRSVKYEYQKSIYSKKQAYSALLPQATATGSFTDNTSLQTTLLPGVIVGAPEGTYIPVKFGQQYIYNGAINAQMDILNLQNIYAVQMAKATETLNKDSLAKTRKNVYQQIATNYYSYLLVKQALQLSSENIAATDSVFQSVANKFKEGTVSEINYNKAKINLERSQQNYLSSDYQMQTAKNNLRLLLNLSLNDSLDIVSSLEPDLQVYQNAAFKEDPAIRLAYNKAQISIAQCRSAKSAFAPVFTVLYNYSTVQNNNTFEPFSGSAPWYNSSYWGLRATFPLFNSGSRIWQIKKNNLDYQETMLKYEYAGKQSAINDENLRLSYLKSVAVLQKGESIMKLYYSNYQHASDRYNAGISSIDERLQAFSDYIDYQNQYLNNLSDMLVQLYQVRLRQQSF